MRIRYIWVCWVVMVWQLSVPVAADVWDSVTLADTYGVYQVAAPVNGGNTGAIRFSETRTVWADAGGGKWNLQEDLSNGRLLIGPDNPTWNPLSPNHFEFVLETDEFGVELPIIAGFNYAGEYYALVSNGPPLDYALQIPTPGISAHYRDSANALLQAQAEYDAGQYALAKATLDALWAQYPVGDSVWWSIFGDTPFGLNLGTPPSYYALRQLTDMTEWRLANPAHPGAPRTITMTVVLVGQSNGLEPRNMTDLQNGQGSPVTHTLDPRVTANSYAAVHESLSLFKEYIHTITLGMLEIQTNIVELPSFNAPVQASESNGALFATIVDPIAPIQSLTQMEIDATDWWWVVYPSHVPDHHAPFQYTAFITGGMGLGPYGSPVFIIDDQWLVRVPPHLGLGEYEPQERTIYLSQWLQHEIFHHFYIVWNSFALEAQPHQWFDINTWPGDFVGQFEPDYYHESVFKRFHQASLPFHVGLRKAVDDAPWDQVDFGDVTGVYERKPNTNPWHLGDITATGSPLLWQNTANVSWNLDPDFLNGALGIGPDCPYYDPNVNNDFQIQLERDNVYGDLQPSVNGFFFLGELYTQLTACDGAVPDIRFSNADTIVWDADGVPSAVYIQGSGYSEIQSRTPRIVSTPTVTTASGMQDVSGSQPPVGGLHWWLFRVDGDPNLCSVNWSTEGSGEAPGRDAQLP